MIRFALPLAIIALAGCDAERPAEQSGPPGLSAPQPPIPAAPEDLTALRSEDCVDAAQFYLEMWGSREYDRAALAWDDPVIDGARLEALLAGYEEPEFTWTEPSGEQPFEAGALPRCQIVVTLLDASNPETAPRRGTINFLRVTEAPGPQGETPGRWRIQSQTLVEELQRAGRDSPA